MPKRWLTQRQLADANAAFLTEVNAAIEALGGVVDIDASERWLGKHYRLETRVGTLTLQAIYALDTTGGWVACRFEDPEAANTALGPLPGLNPHSGKWNLHMEGLAGGYAELLEQHLRPALLTPKEIP
jgi:hypothetical protein